ncbi:SH3 domain-binding protein 5-like protein [Aphelenchoides fujianensis]|nr:SH3 domain-binding protein 5-like protein [Aphelenchoides fujianensis]
MNGAAHEVLVGRRPIQPPQTVDPSALLHPSAFQRVPHAQSTPAALDEHSDGDELELPMRREDMPTSICITDAAAATQLADCRPTSSSASSVSSAPAAGKGHQRKCSSEDGIHYVDDDDGVEFQLDQRHLNRVHEELEKLNIATDVINKLELQLDHARDRFRQIHSEWSKRSEEIKKKYDSAIKKSRPYYEAKGEERKLREQAQEAAIRFERANSMLQVAKQQVKLTQDSLTRQTNPEPACLEVMNHHVQRVSEAEKERYEAEEAHRQLSHKLIECTQRVAQAAKENSRSIKKTRHYFDLHLDYRRRLDQQKQLISRLEAEVKQKKRDYTSSLRNLEQISDSIHEERSLTSTKHSARTPDSTRKSVSAVGLSKLQLSDAEADEVESAIGDVDEVDGLKRDSGDRRSQRQAGGSFNGADTHSTTSSSSGGISISMSQRDLMISELCAGMPDSLLFDDDYDYRNSTTTGSSSVSTRQHGRSTSELSGLSESSQPARPMGNGVILLAQRLLGGDKQSGNDSIQSTRSAPVALGREEDFFYHTAPEGIAQEFPPTTANPAASALTS